MPNIPSEAGRPDQGRFAEAYRNAVEEIFAFWEPGMQTEIAAHCEGWAPGRFDFRAYLDISLDRYFRAYRAMGHADSKVRVCDVGGFWGVFPVTLRLLGHEVTMTETLRYYSRAFDRLFDHIRSKGVLIEDYDPFQAGSGLRARFDFVTVMAVLEHYPHSLKTVMANLKSLLAPGGRLYLEVPNIAYWPKRWGLLWGRSPLPPLGSIYRSEVPFIGHHHEFTMAELIDLAGLSGLRILARDTYNYSPDPGIHWRTFLPDVLRRSAYRLSGENRECLTILCGPSNDA